MGLGFDLDQDWKILIRLGYGTGKPNRIAIFPIRLENITNLTLIFVMEPGPECYIGIIKLFHMQPCSFPLSIIVILISYGHLLSKIE